MCLPGVLDRFQELDWMEADGWKATGGTLCFCMLPHVTKGCITGCVGFSIYLTSHFI